MTSKEDNHSQVLNIKLNENDEIELIYNENSEEIKEEMETEETIEGGIKLVVLEEEEEGDDDDDYDREKNSSDDEIEEVVEHICGKCNKSFTQLTDLKKHLPFCRENSETNLRKQEMFQNLAQIERECIDMEKKELCFCCNENFDTCHAGHIRCTECPKSFKNTNSFERHIFLSHSDIDKFPCTICNARCPSKKILSIHIENHKKRGKKYACQKCGKEFTRSYHVLRHKNFSQCDPSVLKTEYTCNVCGKVFYRVDNLRHHLKVHLGEDVKTKDYQCPYCAKSFYGTSTLNIHIRTHTGERPFSCDLCDKYFPSNAALRKHRRYHTGEKPYQCGTCKRTFSAKEVLNRHMKIHTGEKPHTCNTCGKSFIQATQLRKHLINHEIPRGFECPLCNGKFSRKSKLSKHLIDDHASDVGFNCNDCSASFKSSAGLRRHITRMHSKQYFCKTCNKQFDDEKLLIFHKLTHDENIRDINNDEDDDETVQVIPTFQCKECFQTFKTKHGLNIHSRRSHKVKNLSQPSETRILNGTMISPTKNEHKTSNIKTAQESNKVIFNNNFVENIVYDDDDGVNYSEYIIEEIHQSSSSRVIGNENILTVKEDKKNKKNILKNNVIEMNSTNTAKLDDNYSKENVFLIDGANEIENYIKEEPPNLACNDIEFNANVGKLLDFLIDEKTLKKFGWPSAAVEDVLRKVITNCGHKLDDVAPSYDYTTRMREFVKILFTVVIDNEEIKELLNNLTIDEVIQHVVNMAESDTDED